MTVGSDALVIDLIFADCSKEEFIEVLTEIDAYERYCEEHPDYPNNRAVLAIENIRSNYKERLQKHDFLQEGSKETAL